MDERSLEDFRYVVIRYFQDGTRRMSQVSMINPHRTFNAW